MKPFWFHLLLSLALVLPSLNFAQATPASSPAPKASSPVAGVIVAKRVTGHVEVMDNATKQRTTLKNDDRLHQGQTVITANDSASSIILVFSNGATIQLKSDSQMSIDEFMQDTWDESLNLADLKAEPSSSQTKLNLAKGELIGKVAKLNKDKGSTFGIQTPVGAAGIRGTTFRIVFRPDPAKPGSYLFRLSTAEGHVDLMQGAVTTTAAMPATAVTDNNEIVVNVDVTVDAATGQLTITAPPQVQSTTTPISAESTAIIQQASVEVIQAAAEVIISTQPTPVPPKEEPKQEEKKPEEQPGSGDSTGTGTGTGTDSGTGTGTGTGTDSGSGTGTGTGSGTGTGTDGGGTGTVVSPPSTPSTPRLTTGDGAAG